MLHHRASPPFIFRQAAVVMFCTLVAWIGAIPYVDRPELQIILAIPGGFLLSGSLKRWHKCRQYQFVLEQFRRLLEHLLTRMTAGMTLEKAFMDAPESLEDLLGKKSKLLASLQLLGKQLSARQPLEQLLQKLLVSVPCREADVFLKVLPGLRYAGGNVSQYIRQQLRMVAEKIMMNQEMSAETTQRRTEALILMVIPFVLTLLFQETSILSESGQTSGVFAVMGMVIAYILALLAIVIVLSSLGLSADLVYAKPKHLFSHRPFRRFFRFPTRILRHVYQEILPESYRIRLMLILYDMHGHHVDHSKGLSLMTDHCEQKAVLCLFGLLMGIILALSLPAQFFWIFLIPVILCILHDFQIFTIGQNMQLQYRLDYPAFINLITALLQAGLSLHAATIVCLDSFNTGEQDHKKPSPSDMQTDLALIRNQLKLGLPVSWIIEKISSACPVPEIQAALLFLVRYDRSGGQEILDLLQMQSAACWSLYRQAVRKKMEKQSLRLLLPMMLDLVSVILTATVPAWISLRTF